MKIIGIVNNYPQHDNKTEETNKTTAQPVLFTKLTLPFSKVMGKPFFLCPTTWEQYLGRVLWWCVYANWASRFLLVLLTDTMMLLP